MNRQHEAVECSARKGDPTVVPQSDPGTPFALTPAKREATEHVTAKLVHRWGDTLPLSAILLAAFALRIWLLGNQNIWWDEGLAIWAVRQGWVRMTLWTASDVHPPLYFWLLKAWVSLAGESEFAARFISLLCGVVTVAALYPLAKALLGRRIAPLGHFAAGLLPLPCLVVAGDAHVHCRDAVGCAVTPHAAALVYGRRLVVVWDADRTHSALLGKPCSMCSARLQGCTRSISS